MEKILSTLAKDKTHRIVLSPSSPQIDEAIDQHIRDFVLDTLQRTMAQSILDIEAKRMREVLLNGPKVIVTTGACILSGNIGIGKTLIVLAAIIARKKTTSIFHKAPLGGTDGEYLVAPQVAVSYPKTIDTACIVVGPSVLSQWKETIEKTDLTCFVIDGYYSLKLFEKKMKMNEKMYDVILVKNGYATSLDKTSNETLPITDMLASLLRPRAVRWAVYDDYDTIQIARDAKAIIAGFTIFVSSTAKKTTSAPMASSKKSHCYTIRDYLVNVADKRILDIQDDKLLRPFFTIEADAEFIKEALSLPRRHVFKCIYKNPDDKIIGLIKAGGLAAGNDEATEHIVEALNGDAIDTAAKLMGIETRSTADMFHKLFSDNADKIETAKGLIRAAQAAIRVIAGAPWPAEEAPPMDLKELANMVKKMAKEGPFFEPHGSLQGANEAALVEHFGFRDDRAIVLLKDMVIEQEKILDQCSSVINKIKEVLDDDSCLICCLSFEGQDTVISKCCNVVVCSACFKEGFKVSKEGRNGISGTCPNCRKNLNVARDVIYISQDLNIGALLGKGIWAEGAAPEPTDVADNGETDRDLSNPKIVALLDLLGGNLPMGAHKVDIDFDKIADASRDSPYTGEARKVLLFATHDETLDLIERAMGKKGITILRLQGRPSEMDDTIRRYKMEGKTTILLANSQRNCAGLNLQCTTDLVFFHKTFNAALESQIVGRVCRRGQQYDANIIYLLYNNEK